MTISTPAAPMARSALHPRLLLDPAELVLMRQRAKSGVCAQVADHVLQTCRSCMDPTDDDYLDFRRRKSDIWSTRHGIFRVTSSLGTLAVGYALTADPAIGDFARDAMMTIIEHGLADVPALGYGVPTEGWRHGQGHDKFNYALALALVYDLCHDRFSDAQRAAAVAHARQSIELAQEQKRNDWAQSPNNRGVRGQLTSAVLALAFEDVHAAFDTDIYMLEAAVALEKYLFLAVDGQGAPYEGPGYASSIASAVLVAHMLHRRGGPNLLLNNRLERLLDYMLYEMLPGGGAVNNLNDCATPCGGALVAIHAMGTDRGRLVPWLARQLEFHPLRAGRHDPEGASTLHFLLWWRDDVPARSPQELGYPLSHCFQTRGVASMRTGWGEQDWLLSHFCGRQEVLCHRQGDYNHLSFYALGERFLVDAGYGDTARRDLAKPVDRWFGLTTSHNCVVVNGCNQRGVVEVPGWAEGLMLDFQHTPAFDTALGDASACSGPDHTMAHSLRRSMLVRQGATPFVAVLDVNEIDGGKFEARTLWNTDPANKIELHADGFTLRGKSNDCRAFILWPGPAEVALSQIDDHGRPQVAATVHGAEVEMVTVFVPIRRGSELPAFTCIRESNGKFTVICACAGATVKVRLTAVLTGPLRVPEAVSVG